MKELIIPLKWECIDELLEQNDRYLLLGRMPTILRMRTRMLTEELFYALTAADGADTGRLRCTYPAPNQIRLQYRNERGALEAELDVLQSLLKGAAGYGVKVQFENGGCTFTVGVR